MIGGGSRGLIRIDADQQSALRLSNSQRPCEHAGQGGESGEIRFHTSSHCEQLTGRVSLVSMYPSWTQCRDLEVQQRRTIEKDRRSKKSRPFTPDEALPFSGSCSSSAARKSMRRGLFPCVYRRKPRRKGFNGNRCSRGEARSNQICSANVLAGENSKSIALRGNKAIKNAPARTRRIIFQFRAALPEKFVPRPEVIHPVHSFHKSFIFNA